MYSSLRRAAGAVQRGQPNSPYDVSAIATKYDPPAAARRVAKHAIIRCITLFASCYRAMVLRASSRAKEIDRSSALEMKGRGETSANGSAAM